MRKQTKLVAVLSAAALLAMGASMTSFAAGWEKDAEGIWHYYDADGEMATDSWKKDGTKWFYLNDDGEMLTDSWIDDEYYVGSDGAMLQNAWIKTLADDQEIDDPDDDGEHWYYFNSKGKKITDSKKKINGRTYFFNEDGEMQTGWYQDGEDIYYLGDEDEGWRAEGQWLWLEKSSVASEDDDDEDVMVFDDGACEEDDDCDDEGWYWFQSSGKMYYGTKKKKINGNFFMFNSHGQMLYEWINNAKVKVGSNAQLDGIATAGSAKITDMLYYNQNGTEKTDGARPTGWFKIDGSQDVGTDADTDWYYIKKGEAKHASASDWNGLTDDGANVYRMREKINGKYFVFDQNGKMKDGLQLIAGSTYYFDGDGYQVTGKVSNVEEDDDDEYAYFFQTKNAGNGKGYTGEKDGYLYFMGKRLEADDDYKIYFLRGSYYVVNTKGKLQKSKSKKYDIELPDGSTVEDVQLDIGKKSYKIQGDDVEFAQSIAAVPHIELCDNWIIADVTGESDYVIIEAQNDDYFTVAEAAAAAGDTVEGEEE
jgi:glucan-binding YG repeat protein